MFRRLLLITVTGVMLSGCYMIPMAFIGPVTSGYSTASIIQSSLTTGASYMVQKTTGKTPGEHVYEITKNTLQQAYFPKEIRTEK